MKAAIYVRVSTNEQSLENQIEPLGNLARSRGLEIYEVYSDKESAWRKGHQPGLAKMKSDAMYERFRVLIVWALDRLTRDGAYECLSLVKWFRDRDIKVVSFREPWIDVPNGFSDVLVTLIGWMGEVESTRISERTRAGLDRARIQGKKLGRPAGSKDKGPDGSPGF